MSQEDTLNTATLPLPEENVGGPGIDEPPEVVVGNYADSLMAGLFEDIDKLLDGDEAALVAVEQETEAAIVRADSEALTALTDGTTTDGTIESIATNPHQTLATTPGGSLDLPEREDAGSLGPVKAAPKSKTRLGRFLDRCLLASTVLSLAGMVALVWVAQRQPATEVGQGPSSTAGQSDAEFLNYLQRSLEVIGKKADQPQVSSQPNPGPGAEVSLVPVSPPLLSPLGVGVGSAGGQRINVIERVYIPYQTPQPATAASQTPVAAPGAQSAPRPNPVAVAPISPATPGVVHVLVGVLELGDRSAALFEINGVPQRVYIGERIGNGGWSLVSVSNQEVVIRRNGEVRSIFIGQQF